MSKGEPRYRAKAEEEYEAKKMAQLLRDAVEAPVEVECIGTDATLGEMKKTLKRRPMPMHLPTRQKAEDKRRREQRNRDAAEVLADLGHLGTEGHKEKKKKTLRGRLSSCMSRWSTSVPRQISARSKTRRRLGFKGLFVEFP